MDNPDIIQFVRACVVCYAELMDIPFELDPDEDLFVDEDDEFAGYFHLSFERFFQLYVQQHRHSLAEIFEEEKNRIECKEQFIFQLLASVTRWHFRNGYSHAKFLGFAMWTMYLAFRFYEEGKRDFPKAAIHVIAEVLGHYIETKWNCPMKLGFEEMIWTAEYNYRKYHEDIANMVLNYRP